MHVLQPQVSSIRVLLLLVWVMLESMVACGSAAPLRQTVAVDELVITLETPAEPKVNTAIDFVVLLHDKQGQPVNEANVYLDLDMPAMPMGVTRPVALPDGPGRYWTRTAYTMEGLWKIIVVVELNATTYRTTFYRNVLK